MAETRFRTVIYSKEYRELRASFESGSREFDAYLKRFAGQDQERGVAALWLALPVNRAGETERVIAGYYTVNSYSVTLDQLPDEFRKTLPPYPVVPTVLLGRLAVDKRYQGQGLGGMLLVDAMTKTYEASERIASAGLVVHAKDENARQFYEHYGFTRFLDNQFQLILPKIAIKKLIGER